MKSLLPIAAALFACNIAQAAAPGPGGPPPGIDMAAIMTVLPLEGAPKAIPGPYATAGGPAFGKTDLKIYHPADLGRFPKKDTLPVVVWGNGGCAMENARVIGFFETVASHGFLVVTTTAAPGVRGTATAATLTSAIDWAAAEDKRDGSPLKGKIETSKVAVMGQSCGGMLSVEVGADPRVTTIGVFNSGARGDMNALVGALHTPVLLVNGGERDPLMGLSHDTFNAITKLPAFYGVRDNAGHTATMEHPGGGEWANVAWNWAAWQLKGDKQAKKLFVGKNCGLCTNETWQVERKNLK